MSEKQNSTECRTVCWIVAAAVGIISIVMLYMFGGYGGLQAFFVGAFIGVVVGVVLSMFLCRGQTAAADLASDEKPAQRYAREAEEVQAKRSGQTSSGAAPSATGDTAPETPTSPSETSASAADEVIAPPAAPATPASVKSGGVLPSKALPGQAELAGRKGEWKYEGGSASGSTVDKSAAIPAGETAAPAVEPVESAASAEEAKPELFTSAPAEGADDLKLISGVGPKLEQTLNDLGIYRFEQVAAWGPQEIAWVDARLRFKGRIERDGWIEQAKRLAVGDETEFAKRAKEEHLYDEKED